MSTPPHLPGHGAGLGRPRLSLCWATGLLVAVAFVARVAAAGPPPAPGEGTGSLWTELPPGTGAAGAAPSALDPGLARTGVDFVPVVRQLEPSLLGLSVRASARAPDWKRWFPRWFFGGQGGQQLLGSAVVLREDGYLLTSRSLVAAAGQITASLPGGGTAQATVVGVDAQTDLALLKVTVEQPLVAAPLANSDDVAVGQWVLALGRPAAGKLRATVGIVSGIDSVAAGGEAPSDLLRADLELASGMLGGPLLNIRGEVIGVCSHSPAGARSAPGPRRGSVAVPVGEIKRVLPQLFEHGHVTRGYLGVRVVSVDATLLATLGLDRPRGAFVEEVVRDTPADRVGLQPGDVILAMGHEPIERSADLSQMTLTATPGSRVRLDILRERKEMGIWITLGRSGGGASAAAASTAGAGPATATPPVTLGVRVVDVPAEVSQRLRLPPGAGVLLVQVAPGGLAETAGLRAADVVLRAAETELRGVSSFRQVLGSLGPGERLNLLVDREQRRLFFSVILE